MRKNLFMYLFFFAALFIIYQYMNEKRIFEEQENTIETLKEKSESYEILSDSLQDMNMEANYFSLMGNENAMTYLENRGYEASYIANLVREHLYELNAQDGDHPLVPYEGLQGDFKINKVKFLNHRWVVTDFTDGQYWGEMIVEYFINEDNTIDLNVLGSVLYAQ